MLNAFVLHSSEIRHYSLQVKAEHRLGSFSNHTALLPPFLVPHFSTHSGTAPHLSPMGNPPYSPVLCSVFSAMCFQWHCARCYLNMGLQPTHWVLTHSLYNANLNFRLFFRILILFPVSRNPIDEHHHQLFLKAAFQVIICSSN